MSLRLLSHPAFVKILDRSFRTAEHMAFSKIAMKTADLNNLA